LKPERIAAKGIIMVPEGRRIFPGLTVLENLELGTCSWRKKQSESFQEDLDKVFQLFPRLKERSGQLGWSLSGGEQQMLALARGFMGHPRVLLLDEPSLGLAPKIVEEMFETIVGLHKMGVTILLVEQNAFMALEIATRAYVLQTGEIVMAGPADEIRDDPQIARAYLSA
jgi:branched-chain amino acid transport system ATP-binding protein